MIKLLTPKDITKWELKIKDMTIVQWPNAPLWISWAGSFVSMIFKTGPIHAAGMVVSMIAIIIWSYLEITAGVNWFRKGLGIVVMVWTAFSLFQKLQ
jgi:hypothetical protein